MSDTPLNIALIGFGTVGTGVARILTEEHEQLRVRAGRELRLSRIVVRDLGKTREFNPADVPISSCIDDVLNDDSIDLAVQLVGGTDAALEYATRLLGAGKDLITANKALICAHGPELFQIAADGGRTICFEAAVAGGIPVVNAITTALTGNRIEAIEGILNGTSNFILTQMLSENQSYDQSLSLAQELGYAEADPTLDVDGTDAAQKLVILTRLAFSTDVPVGEMSRKGIDELTLSDLEAAASLGYRIKLLAMAKLNNGQLETSVQPTLVPQNRELAQTQGADNIVTITGSAVGRLGLAGAGAGQLPTASAVMADVVDFATGRAINTFKAVLRSRDQNPVEILPQDEQKHRFYLRCTVDDRPHVLADVTDILGRHGISISSLLQDESRMATASDQAARLIIMTHRVSEGQMRSADAELDALSCVQGNCLRLPVAD
ncbi:MAG: homoserine dehydrogenase [Fuerstiella sp.]|nr:homoserine dehydrogenase [Fuerstiella sp.]